MSSSNRINRMLLSTSGRLALALWLLVTSLYSSVLFANPCHHSMPVNNLVANQTMSDEHCQREQSMESMDHHSTQSVSTQKAAQLCCQIGLDCSMASFGAAAIVNNLDVLMFEPLVTLRPPLQAISYLNYVVNSLDKPPKFQ